MRILPLIIFSLVTVGLVVAFNTNIFFGAPLGKLLSPQHGVWQNAESIDADFNLDVKSSALKGKVTVHLDEATLPEKMAAPAKALVLQIYPGRETGDADLIVRNIPAEVKRFGAKPKT